MRKTWRVIIICLAILSGVSIGILRADASNDQKKEPVYDNMMAAVYGRIPGVHGKRCLVGGYLFKEESGGVLYLFDKGHSQISKENAVWIEESLFYTEEFIQEVVQKYPYRVKNGKLDWEMFHDGEFFWIEGYVDLNDRGPGGSYAATLKEKKVTEVFSGEKDIRKAEDIIGGDSLDNPTVASMYQLLGYPQLWEGKWVTVIGRWRSYPEWKNQNLLLVINEDASLGGIIFYDQEQQIESFMEEVKELGVDATYEDLKYGGVENFYDFKVVITGRLELVEGSQDTLELKDITSMKLHPVQKEEFQEIFSE